MSAPTRGTSVVLLVARREFVTQVRSRGFVIGLVVTLVLIALAGGGAFFASQLIGGGQPPSLGLTADTAALRPALDAEAGARFTELRIVEVDAAAGRAQVESGELSGLLTGEVGRRDLLTADGSDPVLLALVSTAVREQTLADALAAAGVDVGRVDAQAGLSASTLAAAAPEPGAPDTGASDTGASDTEEPPVDAGSLQRIVLAYAVTFALFLSLSYAATVATGVVVEKQSRVVELLLAAIRPRQLLAGKVLGLSLVGLLNLGIIGGIGIAAAGAAGLLALPATALSTLAVALVWYLVGFFLFASLYAAVASTVSRQEDLQPVVVPIAIFLGIPLVITVNVLPGDPDNPLTTVLSFVPFFSQTVMPARYALGAAPLWEVAVSALIAVIAILGVVQLAARIYTNSILRTGSRVPLREALRGRS